ncbi:MAG: DUF1853 family protein [Winogradskyella sp.]|uniref:DUF1853 family protein n=1 Tax=Winogradskyella sp. TaxID=1883156 RepID=UPI0017DACA55|nr:DUF1853 family protein [Winogradskyella sp.]
MNKQQLRFLGFNETPQILPNNNEFDFPNIEINPEALKDNVEVINSEIRLGKLVEQFVQFQLNQIKEIEVIETNIQIQNDKITVGELDAILIESNKPIHLEIAYKFYLFDTKKEYSSPLAYWIGPNRNDNLLEKLNKFKKKQFPLLYSHQAQPYLKKYGLKANTITQKIHFKAQLFLPYNSDNFNLDTINQNCVCGFYFSFSTIKLFSSFDIYIPKKLDWLIKPYNITEWLEFDVAYTKIKEEYIDQRRSPLIWVRHNRTTIKKYFVTWW